MIAFDGQKTASSTLDEYDKIYKKKSIDVDSVVSLRFIKREYLDHPTVRSATKVKILKVLSEIP